MTAPEGDYVLPSECGKLAAIRAVLDAFDWDVDDRQYALERIDQIAAGSRVDSGPELGGGAYLTPSDRVTVLAALDQAADRKRSRTEFCPTPCADCDRNLARAADFDTLAAKLGGAR